MVKHMGHENPAGPGEIAFDCAGVVGEIGGQPGRIDGIGPVDDGAIEAGALGFQIVPMGIERNRFGDAGLRPRQICEAAHLDAVSP